MLICQTARLTIRQFTPDDADFIVALLNEESFIRYIADKKVRNQADAINYLQSSPIASYANFGFGLNLVALKDLNIPIGMCGLIKRKELAYPDLGYAFLSEYWGKGYAIEAASAVLYHELKTHSLNMVLAVTLPDNLHSNRLLQRLGFIQTGSIELYNADNNLYEYSC